MTDDTQAPKARRETSEAIRVSRQAAQLVRDLNFAIGEWQAESIRLTTSIERLQQSGGADPAVIEAIDRLLGEVEAAALAFEARLEAVAPQIASHSRVHDTRQALQMIARRLKPLLARPAPST